MRKENVIHNHFDAACGKYVHYKVISIIYAIDLLNIKLPGNTTYYTNFIFLLKNICKNNILKYIGVMYFENIILHILLGGNMKLSVMHGVKLGNFILVGLWHI